MWRDLVALFQGYMGTGLIVIWYVAAFCYLWLHEERKYIRIIFLYVPVILLLLYFNPLFARIVYDIVGEEIYYRILWLLPITAVIAYACIHLYGRLEAREAGKSGDNMTSRKRKRGIGGKLCKADLFALCAVGMIGLSGSFIYSSPFFAKAENLYHVPDSVVRICDMIQVPGREVMAVFPLNIVSYVRQYSPVICMPYGREMTVERWDFYNPLCEAMEAEVLDAKQLAALVREARCHYIILSEAKEISGNPQDFGWEVFGRTDGYVIYRDTGVELVVPTIAIMPSRSYIL